MQKEGNGYQSGPNQNFGMRQKWAEINPTCKRPIYSKVGGNSNFKYGVNANLKNENANLCP